MKLQVAQTLEIPDNSVFVEDFTITYSDIGLVVGCRSKVFAAFIKRLAVSPAPLPRPSYPPSAFAWEELNLFEPNSNVMMPNRGLSCLDPTSDSLVVPDASIGANMSFLLVEGLEDGISVPVRLPISTIDAQDYFNACISAFQTIYIEWIRPFKLGAIVQEVME